MSNYQNISEQSVEQVTQLLTSTFSETLSGVSERANDFFQRKPLLCIAGAFLAGISAAMILYHPAEEVRAKEDLSPAA